MRKPIVSGLHRIAVAMMVICLMLTACGVSAAGSALGENKTAATAQVSDAALATVTAAQATPAPKATTGAITNGAAATLPSNAPDGLRVDADGYAVDGEYSLRDKDNGSYDYWSQSLQIHITRHADTSPRVVWFEAQIFARNDTLFHMFAYDETDRVHKGAHQTVIAQKNHVVFAINGDFAHLRLGWKATAGLLIRNGTVVSSKTFSKKATKYPNLDNLALLPDGTMLAFGRNEHTIDEYVAMGAYDLLAFGPVLLHEGVLNSKAFSKYGWERAPRTAIGMVTPGHYIAIMVEGRQDESRGWSTTHLAAHMQELGAVEAFNLDGGQSATMIFMGEQIIRVGNSDSETAKPRKATEVLGIGQSDLVQLPDTEGAANKK